MSNIIENNLDTVVSVGITSLAAVTCAAALEVVGTNFLAFKISFVAGMIFGLIVELTQQKFLNDFKANNFIGNVCYSVRAIATGTAVAQYMDSYVLLKSLKIFEAAQTSNAQAIAFSTGFLAIQAIGQIYTIISNITAPRYSYSSNY